MTPQGGHDPYLTWPPYAKLVESLLSLILLLVVALPVVALLWRGILENSPADEVLD